MTPETNLSAIVPTSEDGLLAVGGFAGNLSESEREARIGFLASHPWVNDLFNSHKGWKLWEKQGSKRFLPLSTISGFFTRRDGLEVDRGLVYAKMNQELRRWVASRGEELVVDLSRNRKGIAEEEVLNFLLFTDAYLADKGGRYTIRTEVDLPSLAVTKEKRVRSSRTSIRSTKSPDIWLDRPRDEDPLRLKIKPKSGEAWYELKSNKKR